MAEERREASMRQTLRSSSHTAAPLPLHIACIVSNEIIMTQVPEGRASGTPVTEVGRVSPHINKSLKYVGKRLIRDNQANATKQRISRQWRIHFFKIKLGRHFSLVPNSWKFFVLSPSVLLRCPPLQTQHLILFWLKAGLSHSVGNSLTMRGEKRPW